MPEKVAEPPLSSGAATYMVAALSVVLGMGSLLVFTFFLYAGPFDLIRLGLDTTGTLLLDAGLCLAFFLQHSGMIRRTTRHRLSRYMAESSISAVYSVVSGALLLTLILGRNRRSPSPPPRAPPSGGPCGLFSCSPSPDRSGEPGRSSPRTPSGSRPCSIPERRRPHPSRYADR